MDITRLTKLAGLAETVNNNSSMHIDDAGTKIYLKYNKKHRVDGPAVEYANGDKEWFINSKYHRTDGPAVEYANGDKGWYQNGQRHRTDGPAVEYANGNKEWWLNGKRHRANGPAVEYANGFKAWYVNGLKTIFNDDIIPTQGVLLGNSYKLWRGTSITTGSNGATYGLGLYTTTSRKYAKMFGTVKEVSKAESLPYNPARFKTQLDFQLWIQRVDQYNNLLPRVRNAKYPDIADYIRSLFPNIDGIQIGLTTDAFFVAWPV